jgi:hypothetical protein
LFLLTACALAPGVARGQALADVRPGDPDAAVHRDFFQSQGSHFTVLFEGPLEHDLALRALEVLEAAYFRIGSVFLTFPEEPITVILYTQQQFRDITRAPDWAAASYDGRIRVPLRGALAQPEELERVLAHELTHAMVRSIAPRGIPTWLAEGLAVMFEPGGVGRARATLEGETRRLPFERLAGSFSALSADDARLAYAQSAIAAQKLFDEGGGYVVAAVLRDLAAGTPFRAAFEQRLFLPFESFEAALEAPVRSRPLFPGAVPLR